MNQAGSMGGAERGQLERLHGAKLFIAKDASMAAPHVAIGVSSESGEAEYRRAARLLVEAETRCYRTEMLLNAQDFKEERVHEYAISTVSFRSMQSRSFLKGARRVSMSPHLAH